MLVPSIFGEDLFDGLFDELTRPTKNAVRYGIPAGGMMRTDIKETDDAYELDIDLPGYKKEDVTAELREGYLTISAKTSTDKEEKAEDGQYIRKERYSGSCSRSFYVGEQMEQQDIKARFEDGILKITVPKKEEEPAVEENKYIPIEG